jgi:hypothetical protein
MKWITSDRCPPPSTFNGVGVDHWARSKDPWHRDAFPAEHQKSAPNQEAERLLGWMAEDWCGNPMFFVPDGTEVSNGY